MSSCDPDQIHAWASFALVSGGEAEPLRFVVSRPERMQVGSGPHVGFQVAARGVAPLHFELAWDGTHLWLCDPLRLGRTSFNGETLNDWTPVLDHAVVIFGAACCAARAEGPPCWSVAPDFEALERERPSATGRISKVDTMRLRTIRGPNG